MIEQLLDRASKVSDQAEVYALRVEETPVSFEANRLKQLQTSETSGIALRIIRNGRVGLAASTRLDDPDSLVNDAVEAATFGAAASFRLPDPSTIPDVPGWDQAVIDTPVERMVEIGYELIDRLHSHNPQVVCDAGVSRQSYDVTIRNSNGGSHRYRKTISAVNLMGTLVRGTDILYVGDDQVWCRPIDDYRAIADEAIRQVDLAQKSARIKSATMPVLFTARGFASVFSVPLRIAFNGKRVLQGASPLTGKRGQQCFSEKLSLWDDPTIPYAPHSSPFDDEGVPTSRLALAENGIVRNFVYDLATAALAGEQSTGSASRGLESLPSPGISALVISPGTRSHDELLGSIDYGLIVDEVIGATQGNVIGGDFSGNVVLGFKVEKGKIIGRVKDTVISGNVYDLLNQDLTLSNAPQWVHGGLFVPDLLLPAVSVASRSA